MTGNHPDRNTKDVRNTGSKILNGDSWIKEEVEEVTVCPERVVVSATSHYLPVLRINQNKRNEIDKNFNP